MEFKDLTEEQKAKVLACKTPEELLALAKEEGRDLSDEDLERIAGGGAWGDTVICPNCHTMLMLTGKTSVAVCCECGHSFNV